MDIEIIKMCGMATNVFMVKIYFAVKTIIYFCRENIFVFFLCSLEEMKSKRNNMIYEGRQPFIYVTNICYSKL